MKKKGIHKLFNYLVVFCMVFSSGAALAEGGGGGGGSGEITFPVLACDTLSYLVDGTPDISKPPVLCSSVLDGDFYDGSPPVATNDLIGAPFPPTDPDALCRVYEYTPDPDTDKFSLPVRVYLGAGIYGAADVIFHEAGKGDSAQYLKGDLLHRVAEIDANGKITIVVASDFPPEEKILRFKRFGGGNSSNYCTAPMPALVVVPPPPLFYENTLKVEERVVKNGKCNVRIQGTCNNAEAVGWKCTDAGKAWVIANGTADGECQTDDTYSDNTNLPSSNVATYCEFKEVAPITLSVDLLAGGTLIEGEEYFDGEEQCYNENPITNTGEQSFSCFWWASPPFCF